MKQDKKVLEDLSYKQKTDLKRKKKAERWKNQENNWCPRFKVKRKKSIEWYANQEDNWDCTISKDIRWNKRKIKKVTERELYQDVQSASKNTSNAYNKCLKDKSRRKQHSLRSISSKDKYVSQITASVGYKRVKSVPESNHDKKA